MTTTIDVMKQAFAALLEAWEFAYLMSRENTELGRRAECNGPFLHEAITTLRAEINRLSKVEPVAWMYEYDGMVHDKFNPPVFSKEHKNAAEPWSETPLYTKPEESK